MLKDFSRISQGFQLFLDGFQARKSPADLSAVFNDLPSASPLHVAAQRGRLEAAQLLLAAGATLHGDEALVLA